MKNKKEDARKNNGGKRQNSGPRVLEEDKVKSINFSVKRKLIDSPEKIFKLRNAVYQFIIDVYETNLK